jgi:hypothetical protein
MKQRADLARIRRLVAGFLAAVLGTALPGPCQVVLADSVPVWGAKASVPADTAVVQLKKGQFL